MKIETSEVRKGNHNGEYQLQASNGFVFEVSECDIVNN